MYFIENIKYIKSMANKGKVTIFKGYWTEEGVESTPNSLYVFGDNNVGIGKGGQAIIRDLPNTIGIPTKKYPSCNKSSYYNDAEIADNIVHIDKAIQSILKRSKDYKEIVFPADGLGTGLSELPRRAPKTFAYLVDAVEKLKSQLDNGYVGM